MSTYVVKQKKSNGRMNVHLVESHYVPELGQSRQVRQHLGVLDPDSGELLLAARLEKLDSATMELLNKAGIAYSGKRAKPCGRVPSPESVLKQSLNPKYHACRIEEVGETFVLRFLARESGLESALSKVWPEDKALLILWVAMYKICTTGRPQQAAEWFDDRQAPEALAEIDFATAGLSRLATVAGWSADCQGDFESQWIQAGSQHHVAGANDTTSQGWWDERANRHARHIRSSDNADGIECKLFIDSIANILECILKARLRTTRRVGPGRVADALVLMRKLRKVHFKSGVIRLVEIPERTRQLFEAMGVPLPKEEDTCKTSEVSRA